MLIPFVVTPFTFTQHPERAVLHNEVHARPAELLTAPVAVSRWVMWCDAEQRERSRDHVVDLLVAQGVPHGQAHTNHLSVQLKGCRLRWELHGEFVSYAFFNDAFDGDLVRAKPQQALALLDPKWVNALPGVVLSAIHLWALPLPKTQTPGFSGLLDENQLMGAEVAEGCARVYSDFLIKDDGFSHFVIACDDMTPRRLGRTVIRLLEMETYRMAALLALPVARQGAADLSRWERELAQLAQAIERISPQEETALLAQLSHLAGEVESRYAQSHSRFTAAAAYFELVDRRIAQLRERRLAGLQSFKEFMDRRLTPARSTCSWVMHRQNALSARVARVTDLLRTRVEMEQQQSSQDLLVSLNKRQDLQLQMQATVEGLSVAAISYYMVGLVSYVAKGAQKIGWPWSADLTAALVLPFVVLGVWWFIRRLHQRLGHHHD